MRAFPGKFALFLDLRVKWGHSVPPEGDDMTDWIDKYAASLSTEDQRKHTEYQHDLLRDRLISERAPQFFNDLATEVQSQVDELNEKVGGPLKGVMYSPSAGNDGTTSFTVIHNGGQAR